MSRVFVGLSGGVDSAVSAYLLQKQGHNVTGVFLKTWEPDFLPCTAEADRLDAMRVAAHLKIPFLSYDMEEEYKAGVVDYFIAEYRAGRTPNPDVMCNRIVKFGAFWERAKADGAEYIATGHYARIRTVEGLSGDTARFQLLRGSDESKDQSYFLWMLTQKDLEHALFPVGHLRKAEVRRIAADIALPNAEKKDSQGLCFLGHVDMKEFLQHYIPVMPGPLYDAQGETVGEHEGVQFYTVGQTVSTTRGQKMYIVQKNISKNALVVSESPLHRTSLSLTLTLKDLNWVHGASEEEREYEAQLRYHGERYQVRIRREEALLQKPVLAAEGQSLVLYENEECLGGAVIHSVHADDSEGGRFSRSV